MITLLCILALVPLLAGDLDGVSAQTIKDVLIIVLAIGGPAFSAWMQTKKRNIQVDPQPFEVQLSARFVEQEDFDSLRREVERSEARQLAMLKDLKAIMEAISTEVGANTKEAFHRLNDLDKDVAALKAIRK